jgi:hypothetical protein
LIKSRNPQPFIGLAARHLFACGCGSFFEAYPVADHRDGSGQMPPIPVRERSARIFSGSR